MTDLSSELRFVLFSIIVAAERTPARLRILKSLLELIIVFQRFIDRSKTKDFLFGYRFRKVLVIRDPDPFFPLIGPKGKAA